MLYRSDNLGANRVLHSYSDGVCNCQISILIVSIFAAAPSPHWHNWGFHYKWKEEETQLLQKLSCTDSLPSYFPWPHRNTLYFFPGRAGSGGSVPDWPRPRLHLVAPRPVRPRRRIRPWGKGARVLPQEDQGQEGTLRSTMDARKDYVAKRLWTVIKIENSERIPHAKLRFRVRPSPWKHFFSFFGSLIGSHGGISRRLPIRMKGFRGQRSKTERRASPWWL